MAKNWWQSAVVYQIYPESFMDSNRDGIGDLAGIISKLDYIQELGANVIWLCPINCSPMKDNGYDISDYYQINPMFGTMEDMEVLIDEAKKRGIRVLMDLVVNHVSDQHEWFQRAMTDPKSPFRDYFIIRETEDGRPPNNLRSYFGGSSWEQIGDTNSYYFHAFSKEQPDLNWENPRLREEIYKMMTFWLEKGIAGFRVDAIGNLKKSDDALSCCQFEPDAEDGRTDQTHYILEQPGIEKYLSEMRDRVLKPYQSMTVAEINVPESRLQLYIGENGFFSMVFDFSYVDIDINNVSIPCKFAKWDLENLRYQIYHSQRSTQKVGWGALYLENHDQPRSVSKYLPEQEINDVNTKMLGVLFFFLRGTPFIYQGQEIGMRNYPFKKISDYRDIDAHTKYQAALKCGISEAEALNFLRLRSRDNARTTMQWSNQEYAGFTVHQPWVPVNPDYRERNVEKQRLEKDSVYQFYRKMIFLRRRSSYKEALTEGLFEEIPGRTPEDFRYRRYTESQETVILINYSKFIRSWDWDFAGYEVLLNNYDEIDKDHMKPWQAVVLGRNRKI